MKNKILYICILGMLAFSSCDKQLGLTPYNGVSSDIVFNKPEDFDLAVRGMYSGLRGGGSYLGGESVIYGDLLGDNLILVQSGRKSLTTPYQWAYSSTSTSGLFGNAYATIRRANTILANIEKLPAGANKNNIQAEALAIRAMCHFDVVRLYAKRYTSASENTDLGIPYVKDTEINALPARSTMKSTFDNIIADFIAAEGLAAVNNGVGRFNKSAIIGLLSRVYLYKNDFANAGPAADRALAVTPGTSDNPGTIAQLSNIFIDATEAGVLFKIKMTEEDAVKIGTFYSQTTSGIKSEYVPTFDFFSLYAADDARKAVYFNTSAFSGKISNHVAKYLARPATTANILDFKVLRVAEVLLTQAEAYAQNSSIKNEVKALAALNKLRANRYTGFVAGTETGAALLNAIALQRRLELAFENDRFYDLKRQNVSIVRDAIHGEFADGTGTPIVSTYITLPAADKRWFLPFPQGEININPNFVQDPEWK